MDRVTWNYTAWEILQRVGRGTICYICVLYDKTCWGCCNIGYPLGLIFNSNLAKSRSHYNDVIMGTMASQITSLTIVFATVYSDADQRKHQSFASLAFVRGIHRGPVNSPHKWPVTRKMFPFDDVIMNHTYISVIKQFRNFVLSTAVSFLKSIGQLRNRLRENKIWWVLIVRWIHRLCLQTFDTRI